MEEYLAIDSGGLLSISGLRIIITVCSKTNGLRLRLNELVCQREMRLRSRSDRILRSMFHL